MKDGILQSNGTIKTEPTIDVQCIADAVLTMANMPLDATVLQMTVMAENAVCWTRLNRFIFERQDFRSKSRSPNKDKLTFPQM